MYMDIRWKETENKFIERARTNATFVFDTAKDYRKVRITSSMDSQGAQRIAYELERDLHNIDVFQNYLKDGMVIIISINISYWDNLKW